jgi:putative transposase
MRLSRRVLLSVPFGIVHKFWRCHNRDFLMKSDVSKALYLACTIFGLKHRNSGGKIQLQAFCVMNNHAHQVLRYSGGVDFLSQFMRVAHGEFGRMYNKLFKRTGKVANERPRTVLVQETENSQIRVHMYVEANPIRAGLAKFENLRLYRFSSFRFYAFGIVDEFTRVLVPPEWYLRLGGTDGERQRRYRSLFKLYLGDNSQPRGFLKMIVGDPTWCIDQINRIRALTGRPRAGPA